MKVVGSIMFVVLCWQGVMSQQITTLDSAVFENPGTHERIKIKKKNRVTINLFNPDIKLTGIIVYLGDSSMILGVRENGVHHANQFVPFRNVKEVTVIPKPTRIRVYKVRVTLKSGKTLKYTFTHNRREPLIDASSLKLNFTSVSDIKSIKVHRRGSEWIGFGIGAGLGVVGGVIGGFFAFSEQHSSSPSGNTGCDDVLACLGEAILNLFGTAAVGSMFGAFIGYEAGLGGNVYLINGNQHQFDFFIGEFNKEHTKPRPK